MNGILFAHVEFGSITVHEVDINPEETCTLCFDDKLLPFLLHHLANLAPFLSFRVGMNRRTDLSMDMVGSLMPMGSRMGARNIHFDSVVLWCDSVLLAAVLRCIAFFLQEKPMVTRSLHKQLMETNQAEVSCLVRGAFKVWVSDVTLRRSLHSSSYQVTRSLHKQPMETNQAEVSNLGFS
ncbi:hypothetical protein AKJ16_DCAP03126 [Drosera capensis]